jgi:hypothetical protein
LIACLLKMGKKHCLSWFVSDGVIILADNSPGDWQDWIYKTGTYERIRSNTASMISAEAQKVMLLLCQQELIPYEQRDWQDAGVMITSAWNNEAVPKEHKTSAPTWRVIHASTRMQLLTTGSVKYNMSCAKWLQDVATLSNLRSEDEIIFITGVEAHSKNGAYDWGGHW